MAILVEARVKKTLFVHYAARYAHIAHATLRTRGRDDFAVHPPKLVTHPLRGDQLRLIGEKIFAMILLFAPYPGAEKSKK